LKRRTTSNTEIQFVEPLTFKALKVGDRVRLTSDGGFLMDLQVGQINLDDSITLMKPDSKIKFDVGASLVIFPRLVTSNFKISPGDPVNVKNMKGQSFALKVEFILGDLIILSKPGLKRKLSLLDKLRFLWKTH
jgi:hypothetical protein